ncbi:MAG: HAMP domain-containing histidine kinase, partial [Anaerolineae bacterium]|nr:HAMP domain-containing histidine kinase [Anaerolineae bacterium]
MSIRLRLTLLYSTILALTLIVFSAVLYVTQAQYTLTIIKRDLASNAGQLVLAWARFHSDWRTRVAPVRPFPPDSAYSDQAQQVLQPLLREEISRDAVHMLDADGNPLALPMNEESDPLPISTEGLAELQTGQSWMEISEGEESRWLIFNLPVIVEVETVAGIDSSVVGIVQLARPLADRDRSLRSMGITLVVGSLSTSVIAFGVGWALAGTTLRPIQRITETALEIGQSQDFSSRVTHKGPNDELGRLATTFNGMLARLQSAYQQLARALEVQRDFVADVSHELRTPLTTIRGNLVLLRREPPLPQPEQGEILDDLMAESERLTRLVADLLTLARADAGHQLPVEPTLVDPIVSDLCRQARVLAPDRDIVCSLPGPDAQLAGVWPQSDLEGNAAQGTGIVAMANSDGLRQLLLILVDNAVKHGEGAVGITLDQSDHQVTFSVQDSGPGMSEELQARAFDRFYRGDTSRSTPGFGLGLAIARTLTEAQQGKLTIESRIGVGTTVTVR